MTRTAVEEGTAGGLCKYVFAHVINVLGRFGSSLFPHLCQLL